MSTARIAPLDTNTINIKTVMEVVAKHFEMTVKALKTQSRATGTNPRHIGMYLARILTDCTYLEIAHAFSLKQKSVPAQAFTNISALRNRNTELNIVLVNLAEKIRGIHASQSS